MLGVGTGMRATPNPVFGEYSQPRSVGPPGSAGAFSLPWVCYIPGYALLSEANADQCNVHGATPPPPIPRAPVIPAGSEDPNQNPAGPYSVDQVISDTAALQRRQTQEFFSEVAAQQACGTSDRLACGDNCDPSTLPFYCGLDAAKIGLLAALAVGTVFLIGRKG